ncbi:MAG: lysophospholipid acyltransferase family protein [Novosphingobium sp.]
MNATADSFSHAGYSLAGRLRIAARIACMLLLLLACIPLYYIWRALRLHNPWPRHFLGGIAWIAGARVRTLGQPSRKGAFLLANHVSWLDIPVISGVTGSAFVAHSGLADHGALKWLCDMNDTVFVARHERRSVHTQVEAVRAALSDTGALTVFPEGTTSDGTGLLPFKSSLLSALDPPPPGIAIQPLWLDYGPDVAAMAWVGEEPGMDNFLKILACRRRQPVTVHFLAPLTVEESANRKTMAAAARTRILEAMARNR